MEANEMPSLGRLEELFLLDPESPSGLRWGRGESNRVKVGEVAGNLRPNGYWYVQVSRQLYAAHRIVWMLANRQQIPDGLHIDHIDGCRGNNRLGNLRLATHQENTRNRRTHRNNTSGVPGVSWREDLRKWHASIQVDGKALHLGYFTTLEEAAAARQAAEIRYFGEFRRTTTTKEPNTCESF